MLSRLLLVFQVLCALTAYLAFGALVMLGATLRAVDGKEVAYWAAAVLPFVVVLVALAVRRRSALRSWVATAPFAAACFALALELRWPFDLRGWDAHGMGANGTEINALLLPWLHLWFWPLVAKLGRGTALLGQESGAREAP